MSLMLRALSTLPTILFAYYVIGGRMRARRAEAREQAIPYSQERVLVVGSSSGVGREIALQYARRGARVALVGRRADDLKRVLQECIAVSPKSASLEDPNTLREQNSGDSSAFWGFSGLGSAKFDTTFLYVAADCSKSEDSAKIRAAIEDKWDGLDTLVITAGVSSVLPFMEITNSSSASASSTVEGLARVRSVSQRALEGNLFAPLLSAAALIPLLQSSSTKPSILLLSSVAAVIPAPTRALYAATKSASLLLFQSLAIEHPRISFSLVLPASIEGNFRAGAVDIPASSAPPPPTLTTTKVGKLLTRTDVAARCISAVDHGDRTVWLPGWYRYAHALYWLMPSVIERGARKKYNVV